MNIYIIFNMNVIWFERNDYSLILGKLFRRFLMLYGKFIQMEKACYYH
jgi:hypothetical protein